jgi:hypothetical protein
MSKSRRGARAGGQVASFRKLPRKTVSVNWRPIGPVVAELIIRLAEDQRRDFRPSGRR